MSPKLRRSMFRQEAVQAASSRYGVPVRAYGVKSWLLTIFFLVLLLSLITFLCIARYSRKETVVGSLVASSGAQSFVALRAGIVDAVLAKEGQSLRRDAPVISISYQALATSGQNIAELRRTAADEESSAFKNQQIATIRALESQIDESDFLRQGIAADLAQLDADREIARERIRLAAEGLAAAETLHARQLMATTQLRQREEALLAARQQQSTLMREQRGLQSQLSQISAQRRRLTAELAQSIAASAEREAKHIEQRADLMAQEGQLFTARSAGRLASLLVRPGASVQAGQSLGVLLPEGTQLEAELWVPSSAVAFLRESGSVRLLYDAYPYQRFGSYRGRIKFISQSPTSPNDVAVPSGSTEPMYRVVVALERQTVWAYGRWSSLTPGMRLTADLVLDDRPLIVWLLDPVLSTHMRGRNGQSQSQS